MYKPKSVNRLLRANDAVFLSTVSSLFSYNGILCTLKSGKALFKIKAIVIIMLMSDWGLVEIVC